EVSVFRFYALSQERAVFLLFLPTHNSQLGERVESIDTFLHHTTELSSFQTRRILSRQFPHFHFGRVNTVLLERLEQFLSVTILIHWLYSGVADEMLTYPIFIL